MQGVVAAPETGSLPGISSPAEEEEGIADKSDVK